MSKLRDIIQEEIIGDLADYPAPVVRKWRRFGIQREIDRFLFWQIKRSLDGIYRGRWSRLYPDVAVKLDVARSAAKELSDAAWKSEVVPHD